MTYKLNRLFNPKVYMDLLVYSLVYILFSFLSKVREPFFFVILGVVCLLLLLARIRHITKSFSFNGEALEFVDHVQMKPESRGFVRTRGVWWWVKVSYTVTRVKDLEFRQCFIEKMFDVGHITFSGNVTFVANKSQHRITPKKSFVIYGIKNFKLFRSDFGRNFK